MDKTVVITGASGGIGLELAHVFAANGYNLVLIARSKASLDTIKLLLESRNKVAVKLIVKDLAAPTAAKEVFEECLNDTVEVLVNNAGFGMQGQFVELNYEEEMNMIRLNVLALTELTHLFANKLLKQGKKGYILNVASTAAFMPGPLLSVYYATKAYVLSFSEALHVELKDKGIVVSVLCPGATATDFARRAGMLKTKLFKNGIVMDAKTVAKVAYKGLMAGKRVIVPGLVNKILVSSVNFAPRTLLLKTVRMLQETKS